MRTDKKILDELRALSLERRLPFHALVIIYRASNLSQEEAAAKLERTLNKLRESQFDF
jgi:hypothetical protein